MKITAKRLKEIIMEEMEAAYQRDPEPESPATTIAHALDELIPDLYEKGGVVSVSAVAENTGLTEEEVIASLESEDDDYDSIELRSYATLTPGRLGIEVEEGGASVS